jgi:hypothetical protein
MFEITPERLNQLPPDTRLPVSVVVPFLKYKGRPITRRALYKMVADGRVPTVSLNGFLAVTAAVARQMRDCPPEMGKGWRWRAEMAAKEAQAT